MSNCCFNLLSICAFSTPGTSSGSSAPPHLSASLRRFISSSSHCWVCLFFFFFFFNLIRRRGVCLCFADRDVWFLKCGYSLWARLTVYKINAAAAFRRYGRSFSHASQEKSTRLRTGLLQRACMLAEPHKNGPRAPRKAER